MIRMRYGSWQVFGVSIDWYREGYTFGTRSWQNMDCKLMFREHQAGSNSTSKPLSWHAEIEPKLVLEGELDPWSNTGAFFLTSVSVFEPTLE